MTNSLLKRGTLRRRLRTLRRRREAMLLDLGALVLEMHRHGRFLPDSLQRRAAEAVGTDAELRSLSRALEVGDGMPDLVAAGIAGNCDRCGALHATGAAFCSQCGNELEALTLPRKAQLGVDPELGGTAPIPRRPVAAMAPAAAHGGDETDDRDETQVLDVPEAEPDAEPDSSPEPEPEPEPADPEHSNGDGDSRAVAPPLASRRARANRVRQRLDEPARPSAPVPTGLLAGIAAGVVVILVGILLLSSGGGDGGDEPDRAAQTPGQREPEPPPPDEAQTPARDDTSTPTPGGALEPVESVTAEDYDPSGDSEEHGAETQLAVDGDAATSWPTEEYDTGSLQKDGVGLTLQPAEAVSARGLDLQTATPGFDMTIYGAETTLPTAIDSGWTQIASEDAVERKGRIDLDTAGRDFAYYLVWITKIPEDSPKVELSEVRLLR